MKSTRGFAWLVGFGFALASACGGGDENSSGGGGKAGADAGADADSGGAGAGGSDGGVIECNNDGVVQGNEQCDDGNFDEEDACLEDCRLACGDGRVSSTEICDTAIGAGQTGACPTACTPTQACEVGTLVGTGCQAACQFAAVTECVGGDGCCGVGCTASTDSDCSAECNNGTIDPGETCDPIATCPTACDDSDACTTDTLSGDPNNCTAECANVAITACTNGDGCCPSGCDDTTDDDCSSTALCPNGTVDSGETCDGNCPTTCDDSDACTSDALTGSAATCDVVCTNTAITACTNGDGCCASGCNSTNDDDCVPGCGNGVVDGTETCDGNCPASCDDSDACTADTRAGDSTTCDVVCTNAAITACADGDGCCASGCNSLNDDDCAVSCGNGLVELGETCDGNCPTSCADGNACTTDTLAGTPGACDVVCTNVAITACTNGDGCCASGCNSTNDNDCSASCGNGTVETGETCDGNCPASCNDSVACTTDTRTGNANQCNVVCTNTAITACSMTSDGCCPSGCSSLNDANCNPVCGNSLVETGETCDGNCPASCNDSNACTTDTRTGTAGSCNVVCTNTAITACTNGDGCCAPGCNANNDNSCSPVCGNSVTETGETCDGNCPASCDDSDACTTDVRTGSTGSCNVACTNTAITACSNTSDGCCPSSCTGANDIDCVAGVNPNSTVTVTSSCLTRSTGAQAAIELTLTDTSGGAITGATVTMTTTAGTLSAVQSSGNTYWAILTAPAGGAATSATISIVANGTNLASQPQVQLVAPFPTAETAGGVDGCPTDGNLRVRVLDEAGTPINGAFVMVGQSEQTNAYQSTYGAAANQNTTGTTDASGYVTFRDFGSAMDAPVTVTAGAANRQYVTFVTVDASDVVARLRPVVPTAQTGTYNGDVTGITTGSNVEVGVVLGDTTLDQIASFSLNSLLARNECYNAGSLAGNLAIPGNLYIPSQTVLFIVNLPEHEYLSAPLPYGAHRLIALGGNVPTSALTGGGGIAGALTQLTFSNLAAVSVNTAAAGPTRQNIATTAFASSTGIDAGISQLPATTGNVLLLAAGDFDGGTSASRNVGEGAVFTYGFKGANASAATVNIDDVRFRNNSGNTGADAIFNGVGQFAAAVNLYLDAATQNPPAGTANGVSVVLKRDYTNSTFVTTRQTFDGFIPIRVHTARTAGSRALVIAASASGQYVIHTLSQEIDIAYTAGACGAQTEGRSYTLWEVYAPNGTNPTLPTLPASAPRGGIAGDYQGLVDTAATAETDTVGWRSLTVIEGLNGSFNYDKLRVSGVRKNGTRFSTNSADY